MLSMKCVCVVIAPVMNWPQIFQFPRPVWWEPIRKPPLDPIADCDSFGNKDRPSPVRLDCQNRKARPAGAKAEGFPMKLRMMVLAGWLVIASACLFTAASHDGGSFIG